MANGYDRLELGKEAGVLEEASGVSVLAVEDDRGMYKSAEEEELDVVEETNLCSVVVEAVKGTGTSYPGNELAEGVGTSYLGLPVGVELDGDVETSYLGTEEYPTWVELVKRVGISYLGGGYSAVVILAEVVKALYLGTEGYATGIELVEEA